MRPNKYPFDDHDGQLLDWKHIVWQSPHNFIDEILKSARDNLSDPRYFNQPSTADD